MNKFCSNCGKELKENADVCVNCGKIINNTNNKNNCVKGNGRTIATMVLGIVAITWAFMSLLSLFEIGSMLDEYTTISVAEVIGFIIGYNLFSLPTSIVGLCLGLTSKIKNNKNTAGIIMCIVSLIIVLFNTVVIVIAI